ncbi:MAG: diacylglycerol kinase [Lautropia sp.]|nr:diacylglycerol kinase [Lautropia sp.]
MSSSSTPDPAPGAGQHTQADRSFDNPQKRRTGLQRLWHATGYSLNGLRLGWGEAAFRLEAMLAFVMVPLAFWLGRSWVEVGVLAGSVLLLMIVELLNTAIEAVVDRVGTEWHALSGKAKDMGSAAVLLATVWMLGVWAAALWRCLVG